MIQVLDIEDSTEETPGRCKGIKDNKKRDLIKDYANRHDTETSLISRNSNSSQHSLDKVKENTSEENEINSSSDSEEVSNDPTLSWFAGACHVWQSTEDKHGEQEETEKDNKSKDKKGLWNKLSTASSFLGLSGRNIYKNFDNPISKQQSINQTHKSKYFWNIQNKKSCDCKRSLASQSSSGVFGWANTGFSEDQSGNKSLTPVVDFRQGRDIYGNVDILNLLLICYNQLHIFINL